MSGRFCGLIPVALMVALSPGFSVVGLAEQLIVGGSNSFTVKLAVVGAATCHGFMPS